jgi:hypothetical protein
LKRFWELKLNGLALGQAGIECSLAKSMGEEFHLLFPCFCV